MRIGILGGSFNPPHIGHAIVALQIKERLKLDRIIFMPCYSHPFRKHLVPANHRLAMTKYFENTYIEVSSFEIEENKKSLSIVTLDKLSKKNPHNQYQWIVGSDQIDEFHKWDEWQRIITTYGLIVFPRHSQRQEIQNTITSSFGTLSKKVSLVYAKDLIITAISSSILRKRIKDGKSIAYLTKQKVIEYIEHHRLYRE